MSDVITFPGSSPARGPANAVTEPSPGETLCGPRRSRSAVQADIDAHVNARKAYARAVVWEATAADNELSPAKLEEARLQTEKAYQEMQEAARSLLIGMPTDPKGLVDVLMYLEKHFSVLPQEIVGQSLAFYMLRSVRLSLREIAKYGKHGKSRWS